MLSGPNYAVSNLATWHDTIELTDVESGDLIDVETDVEEIYVRIRDPEQDEDSYELQASLTGGEVTNAVTGIIEFVFTADQMRTLTPMTYDLGCLITMTDGEVHQVILGSVPVLKGL